MRAGTLQQYRNEPQSARGARHDTEKALSLYPEYKHAGLPGEWQLT